MTHVPSNPVACPSNPPPPPPPFSSFLVQIQPEQGYASSSLTADEIADFRRVGRPGVSYFVRPSADPVFFPGMAAELVLRSDAGGERVVGVLGVVHPEVLGSYEVSYPCSVCELDVEALM